jgi:hypothetical protein
MLGFRAPARVLVVAVSLLVVAASVLAVTASAQLSGPNHRTRPLHLTKTCPPDQYQNDIGSYCTVMTSNIAAIPAGTLIFYAQAPGPATLDSDVILYAGRGKTATGHCTVDNATGDGQCRLFGGTRTLEGIEARVDVSYLSGYDFAWDGTYRFEDD